MSAIELLASDAASDRALVAEVSDLVTRVYATAEAGLWVDGATRTNPAEMAGMIAAGEVAVARIEGQIVGAVRVQVAWALREAIEESDGQ
jgi:hypothetical protein